MKKIIITEQFGISADVQSGQNLVASNGNIGWDNMEAQDLMLFDTKSAAVEYCKTADFECKLTPTRLFIVNNFRFAEETSNQYELLLDLIKAELGDDADAG